MTLPILQAPIWAEFQRKLGKTVHLQEGSGWSYLAVVETSPIGKSLYCPYGPVAMDSRSLADALAALYTAARHEGAIYVRVEPVQTPLGSQPSETLRNLGLEPAPLDVQPRHSWIIDLSPEPRELLAGMRSSNRNVYRNIGKKGVTVRRSEDPTEVDVLIRLLASTAEKGAFTAQTGNYLRTAAEVLMPAGAATLYLAELAGHGPIAAALTYDTEEQRVYAHAAVDGEHRKLSAGVPVVVQLMLDAREQSMTSLDMWGIAPPAEPEHRWAGFTRFKQSFGGDAVTYAGTWDLPVDRVRYRMYRALRHGRLFAARCTRTVSGCTARMRTGARGQWHKRRYGLRGAKTSD